MLGINGSSFSAINSNPYQATYLSDNNSQAQNVKILGSKEEKAEDGSNNSEKSTELTEEQEKQVTKLKARDSEVRAHEQAHLAAGGSLVTGGASFEYETGPDGKRYAVGGEVSINTSPGKTPEETIRKAGQIRRAALAPAEPSSQDRSVAAQASKMEAEARQELQKQNSEKSKTDSEDGNDKSLSLIQKNAKSSYEDSKMSSRNMVGSQVSIYS